MTEEYALSIKEACKILSIHRQTLWRLAQADKIKIINVSPRRRVILRSELDRYLKSLQSAE